MNVKEILTIAAGFALGTLVLNIIMSKFGQKSEFVGFEDLN